MKVSELIKELEKFPGDKEVKLLAYNDLADSVDDINTVSYPIEVNPDDYDDLLENKIMLLYSQRSTADASLIRWKVEQ